MTINHSQASVLLLYCEAKFHNQLLTSDLIKCAYVTKLQSLQFLTDSEVQLRSHFDLAQLTNTTIKSCTFDSCFGIKYVNKGLSVALVFLVFSYNFNKLAGNNKLKGGNSNGALA